MKIFKRILIVIGIILYANYIIHLPMCVNDYVYKDSDIYSSQHIRRQSIIKRNAAEQMQHIHVFVSFIVPPRKDYVFAITNIFFAIANVPIYYWQLARGNLDASHLLRFIGHIIRYNANISSEHIFHWQSIYFNVDGSLQQGGLFMDYKKEIIEMIQKIHNESMIKFIYGCVKRVYNEERVGK